MQPTRQSDRNTQQVPGIADVTVTMMLMRTETNATTTTSPSTSTTTRHNELHKSKNMNRRQRVMRRVQMQHQQNNGHSQANDHDTTMIDTNARDYNGNVYEVDVGERAFEKVVRDAAMIDNVCDEDLIGLPTLSTTTRQKRRVRFYTQHNSIGCHNCNDSTTTDSDNEHNIDNNIADNMLQDTVTSNGHRVHGNCSSWSPNCSPIHACERVRPHEWSSRGEEVQGLQFLDEGSPVTKLHSADGQRKFIRWYLGCNRPHEGLAALAARHNLVAIRTALGSRGAIYSHARRPKGSIRAQ